MQWEKMVIAKIIFSEKKSTKKGCFTGCIQYKWYQYQ